MEYIMIGNRQMSRFILGGNPFSGNSHQTSAMDQAMMRYYKAEKIKETLRQAEALGVNTLIARADAFILRVYREYRDEGGGMQWIAQTCPEFGSYEASLNRAVSGDAAAVSVHGGVMDRLLAEGRLSEIPPLLEMIRQKGMLAGIAGHNPKVFEWAEENISVDFCMCSYYNSAHRDQEAERESGRVEWFLAEDRKLMTELIQRLSKPVIHYKIMAAGRNKPAEAFGYAARSMRPGDAICVGVFTRDMAEMLREDVALLSKALAERGTTKPG